MKKKRGKKNLFGKILLLFLLIGIVSISLYLFHEKIAHFLKPWLVKWEVLEEKKEVVLYFSDSESQYLVGEKRKISKKNDLREEGKETIHELIKGPRGKLIPTLPSRTKLLNLQIHGGRARVNFNSTLTTDHPGGSSAELMTVYSIVNTLTSNFPQIKQVQILVNGKPIETITGHLSLREPILPKPDLIKTEIPP